MVVEKAKELAEALLLLYVNQKTFLFKQMVNEQVDLKEYLNTHIIKEPVLLDLFQFYGTGLSDQIIKKWEEEIKKDEQKDKTES